MSDFAERHCRSSGKLKGRLKASGRNRMMVPGCARPDRLRIKQGRLTGTMNTTAPPIVTSVTVPKFRVTHFLNQMNDGRSTLEFDAQQLEALLDLVVFDPRNTVVFPIQIRCAF